MSGRCPFPEKDQLTKAESKARAKNLNRHAYDGRRVQAYRCPVGGHHHVGHRAIGRSRRR